MKQKIGPSFLLFLVVALLLWYGNKLNGMYTTDVPLPVLLENDFSSRMWVEESELTVRCQAEGVGARLLGYKMKMGERIAIPMSQLSLNPVGKDSRRFVVDKVSLVAALSGKVRDLHILQVLDTAPVIRVSPIESRLMPIRSHIEVTTASQYMQVGEVSFTPAWVEVRGPRVILDSMGGVETKHKIYDRLRASVGASIGLLAHEGVLLSTNAVEYRIEVQPYTQYTFTLPVRVTYLPPELQAMTVPEEVTVVVNVPLAGYEGLRRGQASASIDYRRMEWDASGKCAVYIDSLPAGTEVVRVAPPFVEPFFTPSQ